MFKFSNEALKPRRLMPLSMELPVYTRVIATLDDVLPAAEYSFQSAAQSKIKISSVYSRTPSGEFNGTSASPTTRNSYNIYDVRAAAYERLYSMMDREAELAKAAFGRDLPKLAPAGDQSLVYKTGGFFKPHTDDSIWDYKLNRWVQNQYVRQFTALLYLNSTGHGATDFSGGEFRLNNLRTPDGHVVDIAPEAGLFVMFPSHPWYVHEVLPITKGMRVCLTRWYTVWNSPEPSLE